jgi:hypothetical protein
MALSSQRLIAGQHHRIAAILEEAYVVPEGYQHPGRGLYRTEFEASEWTRPLDPLRKSEGYVRPIDQR